MYKSFVCIFVRKLVTDGLDVKGLRTDVPDVSIPKDCNGVRKQKQNAKSGKLKS